MKQFFKYIILFLFPLIARGQSSFSAYQSVYDLGLISINQPAMTNRNSALILGLKQYLAGIDFDFQEPIRSIISVSGPVGYRSGIGFGWEYQMISDLNQNQSSFFQRTNVINKINIAYAHYFFNKYSLGHQIYIYNQSETEELIKTSENTEWNRELKYYQVKYQLSGYFTLTPEFSISFLFPNILEYISKQTSISERPDEWMSRFRIGQRPHFRSNSPEMAFEYRFNQSAATVLSFMNANDKLLCHAGIQKYILNRFLLTAGWNSKKINQSDYLFGIGGQLGGFMSFLSLVLPEKKYQVTLTFTPQQERRLVEFSSVQPYFEDIFLYKKNEYCHLDFVSGKIKNITNQPVSLQIALEGKSFHSKYQQYNIDGGVENTFYFKFPDLRREHNLPDYLVCQLKIVAFQQGRQELNESFQVRLRETHQWNGELADLRFFMQSGHPSLIKLTHNLFPKAETPLKASEKIFQYMSRNFYYQKDPILINHDYVIFPDEMITRKAGDCEDLAIFFCSALGTIGIQTALVEIMRPECPDNAHIFVLVNISLNLQEFNFQKENPRRFIFRKKDEFSSTAWIPIEITLLNGTFEDAWSAGAQLYDEFAILKGGLASGIVTILDLF
ncbi:transglutaminase domain-containing protein [candidate division KSB1 bacterium]|nr:transglutaminase domain-containing protein [candidate division KSB1 bacterium]